MGKPIINDRELLRLIDNGATQSEAARRLGVSRQAVNKRLQEIRGKTTKVIIAKKVQEVVNRKIETIEQLQKINGYANELLDRLMLVNRGDEAALEEMRSCLGKDETADGISNRKELQCKDPRDLALRAMAEIRGQLKLQVEIFQTLFSLQAAQEFQQVVLETIAEADPETRNEIIRRLNHMRSIRSAMRLS